jgi:hypothetical protein
MVIEEVIDILRSKSDHAEISVTLEMVDFPLKK